MGNVERVGWDDFLARFPWRQGEHVLLVGPTGKGKTTLARAILPLRAYVIAIGTKPPRDSTLNAMAKEKDWRTVDRWDRMPNILGRPSMKVLFWVKFRDEDSEPRQAYQIHKVCMEAFKRGGWTIYFDEAWYVEVVLKLARLCRILLTQGRSESITVVGATQRPAHIQRVWYDQPTHLFFWRDNDVDNLKRLSGLNGVNAKVIRETVATLGEYEVLYVNTSTGYLAVTKAPAK